MSESSKTQSAPNSERGAVGGFVRCVNKVPCQIEHVDIMPAPNAGGHTAEQAFRSYIEVMANPCNEFMAEITVCRDDRARRAFAERIRAEAERLLTAYPQADRSAAKGTAGQRCPKPDFSKFATMEDYQAAMRKWEGQGTGVL